MSYLEMLKALIREREEFSRSGDGGQTAEGPCGGEKSEGSVERARRRVESRTPSRGRTRSRVSASATSRPSARVLTAPSEPGSSTVRGRSACAAPTLGD